MERDDLARVQIVVNQPPKDPTQINPPRYYVHLVSDVPYVRCTVDRAKHDLLFVRTD